MTLFDTLYHEEKEKTRMADITRTTKTDYKNKGLVISNNELVDADGTVVDIVADLKKVYGENPFDLSVTMSVKEDISDDTDASDNE